jgi:hypothetical protein
MSLRSRGHPGRSARAVPRPRSRAALEAAASLCEMTADQAPWTGTVTAPSFPSPLEVQRRVAQAIERSTYSWLPSRLLPMLPNEGTEKFVSYCLLDASRVFLF